MKQNESINLAAVKLIELRVMGASAPLARHNSFHKLIPFVPFLCLAPSLFINKEKTSAAKLFNKTILLFFIDSTNHIQREKGRVCFVWIDWSENL